MGDSVYFPKHSCHVLPLGTSRGGHIETAHLWHGLWLGVRDGKIPLPSDHLHKGTRTRVWNPLLSTHSTPRGVGKPTLLSQALLHFTRAGVPQSSSLGSEWSLTN